jgi:hypothetical protein
MDVLNSDRMDDWQKIRHVSRLLGWGQIEPDARLLQRVLDWLRTDHGKARHQALYMQRSEVAELLQKATRKAVAPSQPAAGQKADNAGVRYQEGVFGYHEGPDGKSQYFALDAEGVGSPVSAEDCPCGTRVSLGSVDEFFDSCEDSGIKISKADRVEMLRQWRGNAAADLYEAGNLFVVQIPHELERLAFQWLHDHGRVAVSARTRWSDETLAKAAARFRKKAPGEQEFLDHLRRLEIRDDLQRQAEVEAWGKPAAHGQPQGADAPTDERSARKPLTETLQKVYDLIASKGPLTGKEIVRLAALESESVLTAYYIPALKLHGVKNDRDGRGYYVDPT